MTISRRIHKEPIYKEINGIINQQCNTCNEFKILTEFYIRNANPDGSDHKCKKCYSKYYKNRNTKEKNKKDFLKVKYGLTVEQYNEIYKLQEGKCAICKEFKEILNVDHNHLTERLRGLLCNSCNTGLGCFKDSFVLLHVAASYLINYL